MTTPEEDVSKRGEDDVQRRGDGTLEGRSERWGPVVDIYFEDFEVPETGEVGEEVCVLWGDYESFSQK